jgi:drug/metabolite transporter (DMT)-like permease
MSGVTLLICTGSFIPVHAGSEAWLWLGISGIIGYLLGDYCLFNSYILIGSRFGQLFMTLSSPFAAIAGLFILGEHLNSHAILGMVVTLLGISLSIIGKREDNNSNKRFNLKLPLKGILFGLGAGMGQGVGMVFSKLGMKYYTTPTDSLSTFLVPFASTQMRAIVAFAGFLILMVFQRNLRRSLLPACKDRVAMWSTVRGTFFGPFVGVSFSLMAVQYTDVGIASTLMTLTPILILIPSYFYYKQKVTAMETAGAVISVTGASLFFW